MSVWQGSLRRNDHVFSHKTMEILCNFEICLTGARGEMGEEESISVPVDMHSVNIICYISLNQYVYCLFGFYLFSDKSTRRNSNRKFSIFGFLRGDDRSRLLIDIYIIISFCVWIIVAIAIENSLKTS